MHGLHPALDYPVFIVIIIIRAQQSFDIGKHGIQAPGLKPFRSYGIRIGTEARSISRKGNIAQSSEISRQGRTMAVIIIIMNLCDLQFGQIYSAVCPVAISRRGTRIKNSSYGPRFIGTGRQIRS